jgi:hypothetical protein
MAMRKRGKIFRLPLAAVVLIAASSLAVSQSPAPTSPSPQRQPVITDDTLDDFADLNRNLVSLESKIAKVKRLLADSGDRPESQREAFRNTIAGLQAAFADGGEVAQLSQSILDFVRGRLDEAQRDANFPPEEKDALVTRWRRIVTQTEATVANLEVTRKSLAEKLQLLQAKEDVVDQMDKLRRTRTLLDAVGDLADQRQAISRRVRDVLEGRANIAPDM